MHMLCESDKLNCDRLLAEFEVLNERLKVGLVK